MTIPAGVTSATGDVSASQYRRPRPRRAPGVPGDLQPTNQPGSAQSSQSQTAQPPAPQQTFAEMQARGMARPAPPPMQAPQQVEQFAASENQQGFQGTLQNSVSEALARGGSRYALPQVQQVRSALQGDIEQQFGAQRKQLDEEMARRGIGASSIAGGYHGDLAGQQSRAMANLDASLIQDAARTNQQDLSAALAAGQSFDQSLFNRDLSGFGANLQGAQTNNAANMARAQFNEGQYNNAAQLALVAGQAAGSLGLGQGQLDLGNRAQSSQEQQFDQNLGENSRQFNLQQALQDRLGTGNLNLQEQQLSQQGQQFDRTFGLSEEMQRGNMTLQQAQQALNERVQTGQLTLAQANQALAELNNSQQFGLQNQQLAQQGSQFDRSMALQQEAQNLDRQVRTGQLTLAQAQQRLAELQNSQQFSFQQAEMTGQYALGDPGTPANYDPNNGPQQTVMSLFSQRLGRNPTSQELDQFTQMAGGTSWDAVGSAIAQRPRQLTGQTANSSQFQQQLAQALQLAQMGDRTQNRGIDANAALAQNDLYLRIAQMLGGMGWPTSPTGAPPSGASPTPPPASVPPPNPSGSNPGSEGTGPGITPVPREGELLRQLMLMLNGGRA